MTFHLPNLPVRGKTHRESAVLVMGDLHFGQEDTADFDRRFRLVSQRIAAIREEVLPRYDFDELVIVYLGDGPDIASLDPDSLNSDDDERGRDQSFELAIRLTEFIRQQRYDVWGKVRVEGVAGNHGSNTKFESLNWDVLTLELLASNCEGFQVPVNCDPKNPFLRRIALNRNHAAILYHGHGLRSVTSVSSRVRTWVSSHLYPFSVVLMGHLHRIEHYEVGPVQFLRTGSMIVSDEICRRVGAESSNAWWLFGVSESRAPTWLYKIDLR